MNSRGGQKAWWQQFLDWLDNGYKNLAGTLLGLAAVGMVGFWLAFVLPGQVIAGSKQDAKSAIDAAIETGTTAGNRYNDESPWFAQGKGYIDELQGKLLTAQKKINDARQLLVEVEDTPWDPDVQAGKAREAEATASEASVLIKEVTDSLDQNKKLRADTQALLITAQELSDHSDVLVAQTEQRYYTEAPQYLAKYTDTYKAELQSALSRRDEAHTHLQAANAHMPAGKIGKGDPNSAQIQINLANAAIQKSGEHVGKVVSGLNYQKEAKDNAAPQTQEAVAAYYGVAGGDVGAVAYVAAIRQQTNYWLKDSDKSLASALLKLEEAQQYLAAPGPLDYPAAYEAAKSSLEFSQQARTQADTEVATAQAAKDGIALIATRTTQVTAHLDSAAGAESTLRTYHAGPTWTSVAGNLQQAHAHVQSAQVHKANAEKLVANDTQLFADGKTEADAGLTDLANADSLATQVEQTRDRLESWRSQWGGCESSASSAIESARGTVSQYSSYSSSGVSKFNSATSALSSARSNAASGYYEQACADAGSAASQARSAASQAKSDYDDYVAEQERQRRAREAAQRAAEEAAERARQQSQQSPSYGGGYSSGGSGGGYSSGGGGYSGGGSSGGGSDYGGGYSDSDY